MTWAASLLVVTPSNGSLVLLEPGKEGSLILRVLFWGRRGKVSPIGFCCAWKSPRKDESGQAGSILQADDGSFSRRKPGGQNAFRCSLPHGSVLRRLSQRSALPNAACCIGHRSALHSSSQRSELVIPQYRAGQFSQPRKPLLHVVGHVAAQLWSLYDDLVSQTHDKSRDALIVAHLGIQHPFLLSAHG